jgi:hypothetical protein
MTPWLSDALSALLVGPSAQAESSSEQQTTGGQAEAPSEQQTTDDTGASASADIEPSPAEGVQQSPRTEGQDFNEDGQVHGRLGDDREFPTPTELENERREEEYQKEHEPSWWTKQVWKIDKTINEHWQSLKDDSGYLQDWVTGNGQP